MKQAPSPQDFTAPEFENIVSRVERSGNTDIVILNAEMNRNIEEYKCGFAWGKNPLKLTRVSGQTKGEQFTLILSGLEADCVYSYYAFVNNGDYEIKSKILEFKTNKIDYQEPITPPTPPPSDGGITVSDAKFLSYLLGLCDNNGDGKISMAEAESVTKIDVCTDEIKLLDGIQYFSKLDVLKSCGSLWNGKLEGLDLSYNGELDSLECRYNHINYLQLPRGTSLKSLDCSFNDLETIDLSSSVGLEILNCFSNKLSKLDLSKLRELRELKCGMNTIEVLDVSYNLKLKVLDLSDSPTLKTVYVARGQKIDIIIAENSIDFKFKE